MSSARKILTGVAAAALLAASAGASQAEEVTLRGLSFLPKQLSFTKSFLTFIDMVNKEGKGSLMFLLVEEQGKGIGTKLYDRFEKQMIKQGMKDIRVEAYRGSKYDSSYNFFKKQGFEELIDLNDFYVNNKDLYFDSPEALPDNLKNKTATIMLKRLST